MAKPVPPGAKGKLEVRFFTPPSDLAACFTMIYRLDFRPDEHETVVDYIHPEWANLRFMCGTAHKAQIYDPADPDASHAESARFVVNGPTSLPIKLEIGATRAWGIGIRPLGWARFIRQPASDWVNTICDAETEAAFEHLTPLADMLCNPSGNEEHQLQSLIGFFRHLSAQTSEAASAEEEKIIAIQKAKENPFLASIDDFAEATGMHKRTLERTCKKHFGFPPRTLIRRRRMNRSLTDFMLSEGDNWTESIDRHYHDQPHFVREFRSFMGMSPTEYAALPHPIISAFMEERRRVWGSPVRTRDAQPRGNTSGVDV